MSEPAPLTLIVNGKALQRQTELEILLDHDPLEVPNTLRTPPPC